MNLADLKSCFECRTFNPFSSYGSLEQISPGNCLNKKTIEALKVAFYSG